MGRKNSCNWLILPVIILFASCKVYNATAPKEEINTSPIKQETSSLYIPVGVSNETLSKLVQSKLPNPLIQGNFKQNIAVFNPTTVPTTIITNESYQYTCDVIQTITKHIPLIGNKLSNVVVHHVCDGIKVVTSFAERPVTNKINVDVPIAYKVILESIHLDGNGNQLAVHVLLDFQIKADVDMAMVKTLLVSCGVGEPMPQIELTLLANLNFDANGNLVLANRQWQPLKWNRPCKLTALEIKAEDLINLPGIKALVDKEIDDLVQNKIPGQINIAGKLSANWDKISRPVALGKYGFLELNISQLNTGDPFISKDSILLTVGALCKPVFTVEYPSPSATDPPFPVISNNALETGFNINILGTVSFDSLNKYVSPLFDQYKSQIEKYTLRFRHIHVYQSGDRLVVEVAVSQPFRGKVYLWGHPAFNDQENSVYLDSLEYTVESKALLGQIANWIVQTGIIEKDVKKAFQYKYGKKLSAGVTKLSNLNEPLGKAKDIYLMDKLIKISPVRVIVSDNNLNIIINSSGEAILDLR
jgi:hypothetical protein